MVESFWSCRFLKYKVNGILSSKKFVVEALLGVCVVSTVRAFPFCSTKK